MQLNLSSVVGLYVEPGVSYYFDNGSSVSNIYKEKPLNFNLEFGLRFSFGLWHKSCPFRRPDLILLHTCFLFWETFGLFVLVNCIYNLMIISILIVLWIVKSGNFKIKTARTLARKKEKVYLCRCSGALFASRPTGWKGNGVRVPDRPAAVNSFIRFHDMLHPLFRRAKREGHETRVSQKTCLWHSRTDSGDKGMTVGT